MDRGNEVSKMLFYNISIMCLKGSGTISIHENGFKFLNQVESKTIQFEIVFKLLARFSTQFRVKESFKLLFAIQVEKF